MSVLFILLIVSLVVAIGFLGAFLWAVKNGQYEDDHTPSMRILFEDGPNIKQKNHSQIKTREENE